MPKKKYKSKGDLESDFQKMVERKFKKGQISKATYTHYKSPTRHVTKAGDPKKYTKMGLPTDMQPQPRKKKKKKVKNG